MRQYLIEEYVAVQRAYTGSNVGVGNPSLAPASYLHRASRVLGEERARYLDLIRAAMTVREYAAALETLKVNA